jgi:hypothetical protein
MSILCFTKRLLLETIVSPEGIPLGQNQFKEGTMKYVCLMYQDESLVQKMPKEEMGKLNVEYRAFGDAIQKSGQLITSQGLQPTPTATTVRVRDGKTLTTDGPFAETKEQLGGIYIIEAKDLNDAIQFASRIPSARFGSIEVRPVWGYWG